MTSSARSRPYATGVLRIIKNVDDYTDNVFNRITYPEETTENMVYFVDGSEVNNISGVCDISSSNAGVTINTNEFNIVFSQLQEISSYPTT